MWYAAIDRVQFFSVTSIKKPLLLYKWTVNIVFKQFSKLTSDENTTYGRLRLLDIHMWKKIIAQKL